MIRFFSFAMMLWLTASWTMAQEFDTDVPTGWAVVPGYGDSSSGLKTTTGGAGGQVVTATSGSELASYTDGDEPRIILVKGTLSGSDVNIGSNKTIIGVGSNAKISGFYLNMNDSENIIIRNLEITGGTDGIAARYTDHLWIDHCDLYSTDDGLIDITRESDRYTVSWCIFSNHHKTMLLNGGSTHTSDAGKLNGTIHHNWFDGSDTRNPRAGFGKIHVFNNKYDDNDYCIGLHSGCRVVAESNYFEETSDPIHQMYTSDPNDAEYGSCLEVDNIFFNCSGDIDDDGNGFNVGEYYLHDFLLDSASSVPSIVEPKTGPAAEYATIGLMPTPGQGAVGVDYSTLSWKTGTATPNSYIVYFGTTTNPPQVATTTSDSYDVGSLDEGVRYYWRVDQVTSDGTISGKLWTFKANGISEEGGREEEEETTTTTTTIQENETGFCNVDGSVDSNNSGFTNTNNATGNGIDWKIDVSSSGIYTFSWRYANGKSDRPANLLINGSTAVSNINFTSTGSWTNWTTISVDTSLSTGIQDVRLEATSSGGLANIDYIEISGGSLTTASCSTTTTTTYRPPTPLRFAGSDDAGAGNQRPYSAYSTYSRAGQANQPK